MRSPEQLLKAWEKASKEKPLIVAEDELDNFSKAMKISNEKEDARLKVYSFRPIPIMDRDILLKNGIKSPINPDAIFTNRREWGEHLKRNGCVEIGNDFNNLKPSKELKGEFNCREELTKATHQVAEKYGH